MNSSIYFIVANDNKLNWHENSDQKFYYDNSAVLRLKQNDLVYFILPDKVIYAVKQLTSLYKQIVTFDLSVQIIDILKNTINTRSMLHLITDEKLIELSIKRNNRREEILDILYTELLRVYANIKTDIFAQELNIQEQGIEDYFDKDTYLVFNTLKEFDKYEPTVILEAVKLLEPENYELAEFKKNEHNARFEKLNQLAIKYKEILKKSSNNINVLDFLPQNESLVSAKNGLVAAKCFSNDKILELLREYFPAETNQAIESYITKGQIVNNELIKLEEEIKDLKRSLGIEYESKTAVAKIIAPIQRFPLTEKCEFEVNKVYAINKVFSREKLSIDYNTYAKDNDTIKIFMIQKWIIENYKDVKWVIKGEGKSESQYFGQNFNSKVRNGNLIMLFEVINDNTCRFKAIAKYKSHKEVIETNFNNRRSVIHFTIEKV